MGLGGTTRLVNKAELCSMEVETCEKRKRERESGRGEGEREYIGRLSEGDIILSKRLAPYGRQRPSRFPVRVQLDMITHGV